MHQTILSLLKKPAMLISLCVGMPTYGYAGTNAGPVLIEEASDSSYVVELTEAGQLLTNIGIANVERVRDLSVTGDINGTDILTIRKLVNLRALDLKNARIVSGGLTYYESYQTEDDVVGRYSFHNLPNLKEMTLPEHSIKIAANAFSGCRNLKIKAIPEAITYIGENAFNGCSSIESVTLGESLSYLGKNAFKDCTSLHSIVWKSDIANVGESVFEGCLSIKELEIGSGVTSIPQYMFQKASGPEKLVIPPSVKTIGRYAFAWCKGVKHVELPDGVDGKQNGILSAWFRGCESLMDITIPSLIRSIEASSFESCRALESVIIPDCVEELDDYVFHYCSNLRNVVLGRNLMAMGQNAFKYCNKLVNIWSLNPTPPKIDSSTFMSDHYSSVNLYVAESDVAAYWLNPNWEQFKNIKAGEPDYSPIKSVEFINPLAEIEINKYETFEVRLSPQNTFYDAVEWSVSDPDVMSVYSTESLGSGLHRCMVHAGDSLATAALRAHAKDGSGVVAVCHVSIVQPKIQKIELESHETITCMGISSRMEVYITPSDLSKSRLIVESSDTTVVKVSDMSYELSRPSFWIISKEPGIAEVRVFTTDGSNLSDTCHVTVMPPLPTRISITPQEVSVGKGESVGLDVVIYPEEYRKYEYPVEWHSDNEKIASIDKDGILTGIGWGKTSVRASVRDMYGKYEYAYLDVRVEDENHMLARSIEVRDEDGNIVNGGLGLWEGGSAKLSATVLPKNASQELVWGVEGDGFKLDDEGRIYDVTGGGALWIKTTDGSDVMAVIEIQMKPWTFEITPQTITLAPNTATKIATKITSILVPESITWQCEHDSIATIYSDGKAVAHAYGITAFTGVARFANGKELKASGTIRVEDEKQPLAQSIIIHWPVNDTNAGYIEEGESKRFTTEVLPKGALQKTRLYISESWAYGSDDYHRLEAAKLASDGTVTGLNEGYAVLVAETTDGTNIRNGIDIKIIKSAGLEPTATERPKVVVSNGAINIYGVDDREMVRIHSLDGTMLYFGRQRLITGLRHGVYLVTVGGECHKVII